MLSWKYKLDRAILGNDVMEVTHLLRVLRLCRVLQGILHCIHLGKPRQTCLLHLAAYSNSVEVARLLVDRHEEVGSQNDVGDTPLHVAARYNAWETADLLISQGARVCALNRAGQTPLDIANDAGNHSVAELLELVAGWPTRK